MMVAFMSALIICAHTLTLPAQGVIIEIGCGRANVMLASPLPTPRPSSGVNPLAHDRLSHGDHHGRGAPTSSWEPIP